MNPEQHRGLLNLSPIFDDAASAVRERIDAISVPPLPAAVFMMQQDVINHYRYALTHYFALTLTEPFLQGSSLGTPYDKWKHVTNEDFAKVGFAIYNLLRYTGRLVYDSASGRGPDHYSKAARRCSPYISALGKISMHGKSVGVAVADDHRLTITGFDRELVAREYDIRDRSTIDHLKALGLTEVEELAYENARFAELCSSYYGTSAAVGEFDSLFESWCI